MHFVLQTPSLQHLAEVKIVTHLWTQRDIFAQIAGTFTSFDYYALITHETNAWKALAEKVKDKVCSLPIPEQCKKPLFNLIKPLGMELIIWCENHRQDRIDFHFVENFLPQQLCWTMHGTVNYAKTAALMVKNERVEIGRRYEIACINCLEDEARELFHIMGEDERQEYVNKVRDTSSQRRHRDHLIIFLTCTLTGDMDDLHKRCYQTKTSRSRSSFHKRLFKNMLRSGNRATCEYLFTKVSRREKERSFFECMIQTFSRTNLASTSSLLYYLSLLNAEQQRRASRWDAYDLLLCLLRWPMQPLFMAAAECGWCHMDKKDCSEMLLAITLKVRYGFQDFDYWQLFCECWRLTPAEYRQQFLCSDEFLEELLLTKQLEFIQFILNEGALSFVKDLHVGIYFDGFSNVLMDESAISDAALMECKETAVLISSNDKENEEKRLRSEYVGRLVHIVMEERVKRRRLV